jgi:hypothetical protein
MAYPWFICHVSPQCIPALFLPSAAALTHFMLGGYAGRVGAASILLYPHSLSSLFRRDSVLSEKADFADRPVPRHGLAPLRIRRVCEALGRAYWAGHAAGESTSLPSRLSSMATTSTAVTLGPAWDQARATFARSSTRYTPGHDGATGVGLFTEHRLWGRHCPCPCPCPGARTHQPFNILIEVFHVFFLAFSRCYFAFSRACRQAHQSLTQIVIRQYPAKVGHFCKISAEYCTKYWHDNISMILAVTRASPRWELHKFRWVA